MKINALLQSSDPSILWTLAPRLACDPFAFRQEGAGALLLIGMHLTDPKPWTCARNPLFFSASPGLIDRSSKRILGKRFRSAAQMPAENPRPLDPIAIALEKIESTGHDFHAPVLHPEIEKRPGFLLPRKLSATLHARHEGNEFILKARNFSEISQCLHAELAAIFALGRLLSTSAKPRLESFHLDTTLKPCKMCAAFLHILRSSCDQFKVRYHEDDPGPLAAKTLLDQFGYQ